MDYDVEMVSVDGRSTALGAAGPFTVVADRPADAGGGGRGFNGGQLLYLAVAACISNDLFREAARDGITLRRVRVAVRGGFAGRGSASDPIEYDVEVNGDAPGDRLEALLAEVDRIAEIPLSIRNGTPVMRGKATVVGS